MKSCKSMKGAIQQRTGPKGGKQWRCGNGPWKYGAPPAEGAYTPRPRGKLEEGTTTHMNPKYRYGKGPWKRGNPPESKDKEKMRGKVAGENLHGMTLDEHQAWWHKHIGLPAPTQSLHGAEKLPRYRDAAGVGKGFDMPILPKHMQAEADARGDYRKLGKLEPVPSKRK